MENILHFTETIVSISDYIDAMLRKFLKNCRWRRYECYLSEYSFFSKAKMCFKLLCIILSKCEFTMKSITKLSEEIKNMFCQMFGVSNECLETIFRRFFEFKWFVTDFWNNQSIVQKLLLTTICIFMKIICVCKYLDWVDSGLLGNFYQANDCLTVIS